MSGNADHHSTVNGDYNNSYGWLLQHVAVSRLTVSQEHGPQSYRRLIKRRYPFHNSRRIHTHLYVLSSRPIYVASLLGLLLRYNDEVGALDLQRFLFLAILVSILEGCSRQ